MEAELVLWSCGARGRVPRRAQRRAILFFWPTRASSCHHSSRGVPFGRPALIVSSWAGRFFKSLQRLRVLGRVTGAGRELAIAQSPQFPAQRRLADRDPKLLPDPKGQILQAPANHAVDRRRRAALHRLCQGLALVVVQLAGVPRGLAVDQALRAASVELHNPVPKGLQPDAADPRRLGPGAAVVDLGQRQQPPTLTRVPGRFRQAPKLGCVIVRTKCNPWPHGEPPFASREADSLRSENPGMSQPSRGLVLAPW